MGWSDLGVLSVSDFDGFRLKSLRPLMSALAAATEERFGFVKATSTPYTAILRTRSARLSSSIVSMNCLAIDKAIDAMIPLYLDYTDWPSYDDPSGGTLVNWTEATMLAAIGASERIRLSDQSKNFIEAVKQAYLILNKLRVSMLSFGLTSCTMTIRTYRKYKETSATIGSNFAALKAAAEAAYAAEPAVFWDSGRSWTEKIGSNYPTNYPILYHRVQVYQNTYYLVNKIYYSIGRMYASLLIGNLSAFSRKVLVVGNTYRLYPADIYEDPDFNTSEGQLTMFKRDADYSNASTRSYDHICPDYDDATLEIAVEPPVSGESRSWAVGYVPNSHPAMSALQVGQFSYNDGT